MKRNTWILILIALITVFVAGCSGAGQSESTASDDSKAKAAMETLEPIMDISEYPSCDGSFITIPMSEAVCAALTGEGLETTHNIITHTGGEAALSKLIDFSVDIIFLEGKSTNIIATAKDKSVDVEPVAIARDEYVFFLNDGNEGGDITKEQAESVLNGTSSTNIQVVCGYFFSDYVPDGVSVCTVDGVAPTAETLRSGEYPYCVYYYAVIRADYPADGPARKIIAELKSERGQNLLKEVGYETL